MPKKSSTKEESIRLKSINLPRELIRAIFEGSRKHHHYDQFGYPPGSIKSWIKPSSSRPCIHSKQPLHLQITEPKVTVPSINGYYTLEDHTYAFPHRKQLWNLTREGNKDILSVTYRVSMVDYSWRRSQSPWIKHEITTIDPYDSTNQVMTITNVIGCDGKFYVLSMQGCLVVMEENHDARLIIKGMCRTRAVPSVSAKYFNEYLIESRREVLLVFLIYQTSIERVDEIEVYRVDLSRLDLVKVDDLQGRTIFLEEEYCLWVDSKEIGCKGDCVYFFDKPGGNRRWWMYDIESRSISMDERRIE